MPDNSKSLDTSPSNSIIDRILGRTPSDPEFDKRMALAKQVMTQEMPSEMTAANIQPMGMFGKISGRLSQVIKGNEPNAVTGPSGGISYNPSTMSKMSQNDIEDVLAHELTHVGQFQKMGPIQRYLTPVVEGTKSLLGMERDLVPQASLDAYRKMGWDPNYRGYIPEVEAFQTENERKMKRGEGSPGYDIQLPSPRKQQINTGPSSKITVNR